MKYNQKHNIFGWLAVSTLLLTTACAGVADFDVAQVDNSEPKTVTFTIQSPTQSLGMRSGSEDNSHISDGSKADILFYTVYEVGNDGNLTPTKDSALIKGNKVGEDFDVTLGDGQSVISVASYPVKIRLAVASETKYQVAFWAQSMQTKAYNVQDMQNVQVIYSQKADDGKETFLNNDELRDAFCAVSDVIDGSVSENKVTLRRPFAQINVGTTGADYKNIVMAPQVYSNKPVTQSKIKLEGVAQSLNVVTGQTSGETTTAEFNYGVIPAFMKGIPSIIKTADGKPDYSSLYNGENDKEEFLKVDLDGDKKIAAYKINYPTLYVDENGRQYLTETFKYLSMCYALVPALTSTDEEPEEASAVLTKVEVSFAETDEEGKAVNGYTPITLTHVPVHRNWRTNILGGLAWIKDPTDPDPTDPTPPDGPDDPSSVFGLVNVQIVQDSFYKNEYDEDLGEPNGNGVYDLDKDGQSEEEESEGDEDKTE